MAIADIRTAVGECYDYLKKIKTPVDFLEKSKIRKFHCPFTALQGRFFVRKLKTFSNLRKGFFKLKKKLKPFSQRKSPKFFFEKKFQTSGRKFRFLFFQKNVYTFLRAETFSNFKKK